MLTTLKDWFVLTLLRILHALGWPWWLLFLVAVIVLPVVGVYTYFWYVARVLRASE